MGLLLGLHGIHTSGITGITYNLVQDQLSLYVTLSSFTKRLLLIIISFIKCKNYRMKLFLCTLQLRKYCYIKINV